MPYRILYNTCGKKVSKRLSKTHKRLTGKDLVKCGKDLAIPFFKLHLAAIFALTSV
jgi:hypothetical protein